MIHKQLAVKLHQIEMSSRFDTARLQGRGPPRSCRDSVQKCTPVEAKLLFAGRAL